MVQPIWSIRSGIAASAIGHLSILTLILIFAEVHPFGSLTPETIAVDLVTPTESVETKPEAPELPNAQPSEAADAISMSPASTPPASTPPASTPPAAAPAQKMAATAVPRPRPQPAAAPPPQATAPVPAYIPPQPDLSVKYQVMLGLPPDLSQQSRSARPGEPVDDAASKGADIASTLVAEFWRQLRTCLKLPESIARSDKLRIVLRAFMTLDGTLATEPVLIEASASPKGPALMQGAIGALQSCQPYRMLPPDRYGEWKVLDLSFTPQDFAGG